MEDKNISNRSSRYIEHEIQTKQNRLIFADVKKKKNESKKAVRRKGNTLFSVEKPDNRLIPMIMAHFVAYFHQSNTSATFI